MSNHLSAVDVLLEDFKARWQESLNRRGELDRWCSLYLAALVGALGTALGFQADLDTMFRQHPYVVLGLAFANGIFTIVVTAQDWYIVNRALLPRGDRTARDGAHW